jgi:hypothetical protein
MSSRFRLTCVALPALTGLFVLGCVDPKQEFGDFGERVVDAAPTTACPVVDFFPIDGEFLLAIQTSLGDPLRLVVTATTSETKAGGTADLRFQPLIAEKCVAGMGGLPAEGELDPVSVPVESDGTFTFTQTAATTPGAANPVLCGSEILADITFIGCTESADLICGQVEGMVQEPIPLDLSGSTFGAVRIETGARGDANLPEAVGACP